jgi:hypothetical protein
MRKLMWFLIACGFASPVQAQWQSPRAATPAEEVRTQALCNRAVSEIERQAEGATPAALQNLTFCGARRKAGVVAQVVRRMRGTRDTLQLGRYWNQVAFFDDRNLLEAATEVALDRSASIPARVYALLSLVRVSRRDHSMRYSHVVGGWVDRDGVRGVRGGCDDRFSSTTAREMGTPLPPAWEVRVTELRRRLAFDASQPLDVRTAAWCISPVAEGK